VVHLVDQVTLAYSPRLADQPYYQNERRQDNVYEISANREVDANEEEFLRRLRRYYRERLTDEWEW
jgi:hypothetical protein